MLKVLNQRGESLWPYSMPCTFPDENVFPYNSYPDHPDEEDYERELASVYDIRQLSISGMDGFRLLAEAYGKAAAEGETP